MKNWNYIEGAKVGNAFSHGDEVLVNSPDWKGMAVVLSQTGSKVRIYSSDGEVVVEEKYVRKVGNQKVGNGLLDMFKKNKTIKMKKDSGEIVTIYSDGESAEQKDERSQMLVHKHNSQKEAVEYYKNKGYKVGNDTPWEYAHRKPKVINEEKTGAEEFFKKLAHDVDEREKKDDADIEKVGNETYQHKLYPDKYVIIEGNNYKIVTDGKVEKSGVLTDAVLYGINQTYKRVGNARYTTREDVISHLDTDLYDICKKVPTGSPSFAYVSELQKKGWDISTISKYTKEIGKIIDQYKVVNSKTGNSASDDKFAYVMREFDEGKLKTPDGKVVTDPAQAKAIAYSESKKTENGLARARKAMNKGITMWKGNDSAYIKEDGTVSYLENNSFETDKDKFESQESAIKELSKQGYVKK